MQMGLTACRSEGWVQPAALTGTAPADNFYRTMLSVLAAVNAKFATVYTNSRPLTAPFVGTIPVDNVHHCCQQGSCSMRVFCCPQLQRMAVWCNPQGRSAW